MKKIKGQYIQQGIIVLASIIVVGCNVIAYKYNHKQKSINMKLTTEDKTEELIKYGQIEKTPFTIATLKVEEETKYYVLMGKYRINEESYNSREEAIEAIKVPNWGSIMQVMSILIKEQDKLKLDE